MAFQSCFVTLVLLPFIGMPLGNHTLLLSFEGNLFAFGDNEEGQLGLGHNDNPSLPSEVPWNGPQPVQVDWGWHHSLVLDAEGGVWEAGLSRLPSFSLHFTQVQELPGITLVAAGIHRSAAIDTEGGLWVWTSQRDLSWASSLPHRVEVLPPLLKVACGLKFIAAETQEGTFWVLGNNSKGQLGLGHTNNALQPTLIHLEECSEGPLRCLAACQNGVILIDSQGGVFSTGDNSLGQLGRYSGSYSKLQRIENIPPMLAASCGLNHTLSLDENGDVWTWGHGAGGQLGRDIQTSLHWPQPTQVSSLKGMSSVVAGRGHSLVFAQEGSLLVFGCNDDGQLGVESSENQTTPIPSHVKPALPHPFTRSRNKSACFL